MFKNTKSRKYNIARCLLLGQALREILEIFRRREKLYAQLLRGVGGRGKGSEIELNTNQSFTSHRVFCSEKKNN